MYVYPINYGSKLLRKKKCLSGQHSLMQCKQPFIQQLQVLSLISHLEMTSGIWEVVGTLYVDKRLRRPWSLASAKILEPSPLCNMPLGLVSLESVNEYFITKEAKSLCHRFRFWFCYFMSRKFCSGHTTTLNYPT